MKVLSEPERLGKYHIQGVLGEGGMGVVYKGYDPQLARTVAIKTIRRNLLMGKAGQELKRRFNREAQAEGSLVHPNIVTVYEYQEDVAGMPFFVMEYVEGKSLKEFLSRGIHFNLEMSLHIITQVLNALAYTHKRGVVHRDIKPANILWLDDDSIKIADFGIAKIEESEFTRSGQVMGTPQYFSPEQAAGRKTDARSDLYSTALVLCELLAGVKPTAAQTARGLDEPFFDRLDFGGGELGSQLRAVLKKALEKNPDNRFQSAADFAAVLENLAARLEKQNKTEGEKQKAGRGKLWLGLGSALGAAVLAAAYFLTEQRVPAVGDNRESVPRPAVMENREESGKVNREVNREETRELNNVGKKTVKKQLSTKQKEKVARLLKAGKIHLLVGRLVTPEGSNAYLSYNLALQIDPGNSEASEGMISIQEKLISRSREMIDSGKSAAARDRLALAMRLFPANRELQSLFEEVER